MSVLQKMLLLMPHVEFESAELRQRFTNFVTNLDQDLDNAGFDTSSPTDDMLESLEECLENLENEIIVQIREATDEEQDEIDAEAEGLDAEEADADAETVAGGEAVIVIEEEETEIVVELEGEAINGNGNDEEEFERELEEEIAEQKRLDEIVKAASGDVVNGTPPSP